MVKPEGAYTAFEILGKNYPGDRVTGFIGIGGDIGDPVAADFLDLVFVVGCHITIFPAC